MSTPVSIPKVRLLLVDDERMVLNVLAEQLIESGFSVTTATHFFDALFFLESEHFDALICDVGLQGQSGFDVLALAQRCLPEVAAVMITGFPNERDRERAQSVQAAYLAKPLRVSSIIEHLQPLLLAVAA